MRIAGIDPGINSSGKCIMTLDIKTFDILDVQLYGYNKTIKRCITGQNCQIDHTSTKYVQMVMYEKQDMSYEILKKDMEDVKHISFEGYAFGFAKKANESRSLVQMGEFIGGMKKMFYDMGKGIIIYAPRMVKRFATGNGNADKRMMCKMFESEYPQFYPSEVFAQIPEFEDPHADICDAFWMAEILRCHLIYEFLGPEKMDPGIVGLLEHKSNKKSESIVETRLVKKT
jgi:Holliday junction resolvasome RuvABC endonuclease subunit